MIYLTKLFSNIKYKPTKKAATNKINLQSYLRELGKKH